VRYSHFAHIPDPGVFTRKLNDEQAQQVVRMKDERRLTWCAIAYWFTRNGTPVSYQAVRETYYRAKEMRKAA
jgi:hypothetical protein